MNQLTTLTHPHVDKLEDCMTLPGMFHVMYVGRAAETQTYESKAWLQPSDRKNHGSTGTPKSFRYGGRESSSCHSSVQNVYIRSQILPPSFPTSDHIKHSLKFPLNFQTAGFHPQHSFSGPTNSTFLKKSKRDHLTNNAFLSDHHYDHCILGILRHPHPLCPSPSREYSVSRPTHHPSNRKGSSARA